jgi:hypothetical protein
MMNRFTGFALWGDAARDWIHGAREITGGAVLGIGQHGATPNGPVVSSSADTPPVPAQDSDEMVEPGGVTIQTTEPAHGSWQPTGRVVVPDGTATAPSVEGEVPPTQSPPQLAQAGGSTGHPAGAPDSSSLPAADTSPLKPVAPVPSPASWSSGGVPAKTGNPASGGEIGTALADGDDNGTQAVGVTAVKLQQTVHLSAHSASSSHWLITHDGEAGLWTMTLSVSMSMDMRMEGTWSALRIFGSGEVEPLGANSWSASLSMQAEYRLQTQWHDDGTVMPEDIAANIARFSSFADAELPSALWADDHSPDTAFDWFDHPATLSSSHGLAGLSEFMSDNPGLDWMGGHHGTFNLLG